MSVDYPRLAPLVESLCAKKFASCEFKQPANTSTVLAGIGLYDIDNNSLNIKAVASGLKCLPASNVIESNATMAGLIHDSHAEVLVRRAFIRYLLYELTCSSDNIFEKLAIDDSTRFRLKPQYRVLLYISQTPCGDASLPFLLAQPSQPMVKKQRKQLEKELKGPVDYSQVGVLRTKPGRGDAKITKSHSCSDKLAVWNCIGLQGALLSLYVDPIYIDAIYIGNRFDRAALERALYGRIESVSNKLVLPYRLNKPIIVQILTTQNEYGKPEATSHLWFASGKDGCKETLVEGRRLGSAAPKGGILAPRSISLVSRQEIFNQWQIVDQTTSLAPVSDIQAAKLRATAYQTAKSILLNGPFENWSTTDSSLAVFRSNAKSGVAI